MPPTDGCWNKAIDRGVPTSLYNASSFLWNTNGIQTGVAANTIDPKRVAVVRGKVTDQNGAGLAGVSITISGHTEFGATQTLGTDGWFDMVVNGGGELVVKYQKDGYLPVERRVNAPWKDYVIAGDVRMTPAPGGIGTYYCFLPTPQTFQTTMTDGRRITILFPANSCFTGGSSNQPYSVRAVEYTTGANNDPSAMPAELPPASGYTFAAELQLLDGTTVLSPVFNTPVITFVDNFLGFNVGAQVPSGYYDKDSSAWVQNQDANQNPLNGAVVTVGSLGTDEKRQLQNLGYGLTAQLWSVPVQHFSTVDYNWPFKPPQGATGPASLNPGLDRSQDTPCLTNGSTIECENQVLGEELPLAGSPFQLIYRSDRVPGYKAAYQLKIPLTGSTLPPSLQSIDLQVVVAGRQFEPSLPVPGLNQSYTFAWDGNDAYGRKLNGAQPVTVRLGYVYNGTYSGGQGFGNPGDGVSVSGNSTRQQVTFWREWKGAIGGWDATAFGLGGWSLDQLHAYSPDTQQLYRGDGTRRTAAALGNTIGLVMGGSGCAPGNCLNFPNGIAFAPDGTLYIAERGAGRLSKIDTSGVLSAVLSGLSSPTDVAVQPDGRLVFVENGANRVMSCDASGQNIQTLIGSSTMINGYPLSGPRGVAVGKDKAIFVSDTLRHRVIRRDPGGTLTVFAGMTNASGTQGTEGNDGLATQALLYEPWGLAVRPDGSLLIAAQTVKRVRIVDPAGYIVSSRQPCAQGVVAG